MSIRLGSRLTTPTSFIVPRQNFSLPCSYAYALETKVLVWGGSLRVLWAKYGEFGGLEVDGFGGERALHVQILHAKCALAPP